MFHRSPLGSVTQRPHMRTAFHRSWVGFLALSMLLASTADAHGAHRVRTLCGWWDNPTPQNVWLHDRNGEWVISTQGGRGATGDWPDFPDSQWVATNGSHGYGCACIVAAVDGPSHQVLAIRSATALPLRTCRKDRSLPSTSGFDPG
jgi:uncharacterized protein DUF4087